MGYDGLKFLRGGWVRGSSGVETLRAEHGAIIGGICKTKNKQKKTTTTKQQNNETRNQNKQNEPTTKRTKRIAFFHSWPLNRIGWRVCRENTREKRRGTRTGRTRWWKEEEEEEEELKELWCFFFVTFRLFFCFRCTQWRRRPRFDPPTDRFLIEFTEFSSELTRFHWVLLALTDFYRVWRTFTGFYGLLPGFTGFYWVLLGFTYFYSVFT